MLLPELEQRPTFDAINFSVAVESPVNLTSRLPLIGVLLCPSDPAPSTWWAVKRDAATGTPIQNICQIASINYVGMYGVGEPVPDGNGVFFRDSGVACATSPTEPPQTILAGERSQRLGEATWTGSVTGAILYPSDNDNIGRYATREQLGDGPGPCGREPAPATRVGRQSVLQPAPGRGVHFLFGDGHVTYLKATMDYNAYLALATRPGRELVPSDVY